MWRTHWQPGPATTQIGASAWRRVALGVRTMLAIAGAGGTLLLSACVTQGLRPTRVWLTASLADTVLATTDTIRVRRVVHNDSDKPIWLSGGLRDFGFDVRDADERAACQNVGPHILVLVLVRVAPHSAYSHDAAIPLSALDKCGPGRYRITVADGAWREAEMRHHIPIAGQRFSFTVVQK